MPECGKFEFDFIVTRKPWAELSLAFAPRWTSPPSSSASPRSGRDARRRSRPSTPSSAAPPSATPSSTASPPRARRPSSGARMSPSPPPLVGGVTPPLLHARALSPPAPRWHLHPACMCSHTHSTPPPPRPPHLCGNAAMRCPCGCRLSPSTLPSLGVTRKGQFVPLGPQPPFSLRQTLCTSLCVPCCLLPHCSPHCPLSPPLPRSHILSLCHCRSPPSPPSFHPPLSPHRECLALLGKKHAYVQCTETLKPKQLLCR